MKRRRHNDKSIRASVACPGPLHGSNSANTVFIKLQNKKRGCLIVGEIFTFLEVATTLSHRSAVDLQHAALEMHAHRCVHANQHILDTKRDAEHVLRLSFIESSSGRCLRGRTEPEPASEKDTRIRQFRVRHSIHVK